MCSLANAFECIGTRLNAFAREHQARLAFGEGVASGSFCLKPGLFWRKTRQLGLLKLAKFEKWHPDVASRGLFLAGKPSRSNICHQQEYLVAVIPVRKAQPRAEAPAVRPNAQPAQMRLAVVGVLGLRNKERSCQRQRQQNGAHDHGSSIAAGGARLRGVGVHSGV